MECTWYAFLLLVPVRGFLIPLRFIRNDVYIAY